MTDAYTKYKCRQPLYRLECPTMLATTGSRPNNPIQKQNTVSLLKSAAWSARLFHPMATGHKNASTRISSGVVMSINQGM